MTLRRFLLSVSSSRSLSSFGATGLEHEFSVVEHSPIFGQLVSTLLFQTGTGGKKTILDMTFGSGGHAKLLLDHKPDQIDRLVVSDCDKAAYNDAKAYRMAADSSDKVVPLHSWFHNIPNLLLDNGFTPGCFDGILIDTGCSKAQWANPRRGFCQNKNGSLDLRYDPSPATPTGSEVLQTIRDQDLLRLMKAYSGMGPNMSKYVTNTLVEARYLFHRFQTTQELYEVLKTAARTYCLDKGPTVAGDEREIARKMMTETLDALRIFVNNDVNELHFAINNVARNFLKPHSGVLVTIVNSQAESRIAESSFKEASHQAPLSVHHSGSKSWLPWHLLHQQPQELTPAEKTLNPRLKKAVLYAASIKSPSSVL